MQPVTTITYTKIHKCFMLTFTMALMQTYVHLMPTSHEKEIIKDRIVAGVKDSQLSENLQLSAELTLEKRR